MSVTDGIGQTPCSLEHYLVFIGFFARLWRLHFCIDRHRFCVRWRVSMV